MTGPRYYAAGWGEHGEPVLDGPWSTPSTAEHATTLRNPIIATADQIVRLLCMQAQGRFDQGAAS